MIRLPFAPMEAHLKSGELPAAEVGRRLGSDARTIRSWRARGVPIYHADRLAVRAGVTVWHLWPDQWAAYCAEQDRQDARRIYLTAAQVEELAR